MKLLWVRSLVTWALDKQVKMMCKVSVSVNGTFACEYEGWLNSFVLAVWGGFSLNYLWKKIYKNKKCLIRVRFVYENWWAHFSCVNCEVCTCVCVFTLPKFMWHPNNNKALINGSDLSKYPVHFAHKLLNLYDVYCVCMYDVRISTFFAFSKVFRLSEWARSRSNMKQLTSLPNIYVN